MADLPYCPIYWRDLLTDCADMTAEQFGAYTRILGVMWLAPKCALPNDTDKLARVAGIPARRFRASIWPELLGRFREAAEDQPAGYLTQKRLRAEWDRVLAVSAKQSERRRARDLKPKPAAETDGKASGFKNSSLAYDLKTRDHFDDTKPLNNKEMPSTAVDPRFNQTKGIEEVDNLYSSDTPHSTPHTGIPPAEPAPAAPDLFVPIQPLRPAYGWARMAEIWNEVCAPAGLPAVAKMTVERQRKCRSRIADSWPAEADFRAACTRIVASDFCTGRTGSARAWRANFDWIITSATNAAKLAEGFYDNRKAPSSGPTNSPTWQIGNVLD